jgi:hypothetical protein
MVPPHAVVMFAGAQMTATSCMLCCVGQYLWCMGMQPITSCSNCLRWQNSDSS